MDIKVLGTGCPACVVLDKNVREVVSKNYPNEKIEHISDINEIMKYNIMSVPALIINEEIVSIGKGLSVKEIEKILKKYDK